MNVGSLLPRHARFRSGHTALVVGDQRLSYRQLNDYVNRLANALLAAGLTKGERLSFGMYYGRPDRRAEQAAKMGISVDTFRRRAERAKARLQAVAEKMKV